MDPWPAPIQNKGGRISAKIPHLSLAHKAQPTLGLRVPAVKEVLGRWHLPATTPDQGDSQSFLLTWHPHSHTTYTHKYTQVQSTGLTGLCLLPILLSIFPGVRLLSASIHPTPLPWWCSGMTRVEPGPECQASVLPACCTTAPAITSTSSQFQVILLDFLTHLPLNHKCYYITVFAFSHSALGDEAGGDS